jgi:hypothetical protein
VTDAVALAAAELLSMRFTFAATKSDGAADADAGVILLAKAETFADAEANAAALDTIAEPACAVADAAMLEEG